MKPDEARIRAVKDALANAAGEALLSGKAGAQLKDICLIMGCLSWVLGENQDFDRHATVLLQRQKVG